MIIKAVSEEDAHIRISKANSAFPGALVQDYKVLMTIWNHSIMTTDTFWQPQ